MAQPKTTFRVTVFAALFYVITAALHSSAFGAVTAATTKTSPSDVVALVQLLWLGVAFDLVIFAAIVAVVAFRPG